jgi:hypothetical protein
MLALTGAGGLAVSAAATGFFLRSRPATARSFLDEALDVMQAHSLKRKSIDWISFRTTAFEELGVASTVEQAYPVVRASLKRLGDNHSFMLTAAEFQQAAAGQFPGIMQTSPRSQRLHGSIGYVSVPGFVGFSDAARDFADALQTAIEAVDASDLIGWIVDLRANSGGNMWPMIAGLGPILGEGELASFIDADDDKTIWEYQEGRAMARDEHGLFGIFPPISVVQMRVSGAAYRLHRPNPAVAVLTGSHTASSGEALCVAFRGRPLTCSFGAPTFGVSTANGQFKLSDGSALYLTTSVMADRTGRRYGQKIEPDQLVAGENQDLGRDLTVRAAAAWLPSSRKGDIYSSKFTIA